MNARKTFRILPSSLLIAAACLGVSAQAQVSVPGNTGTQVGVGAGSGTANVGIGAGASTSANGGTSGGINGGIATGTSVTGSNYKGPANVRAANKASMTTGVDMSAGTSATSSPAADNTDRAVDAVKGTAKKTASPGK